MNGLLTLDAVITFDYCCFALPYAITLAAADIVVYALLRRLPPAADAAITLLLMLRHAAAVCRYDAAAMLAFFTLTLY